MRRFALPLLVASLAVVACQNDRSNAGPPIPASSDPAGNDLVAGAIVVAHEKSGGVRILKLIEIKFFPRPMSDELVFVAYNEKGNDFKHAAALWRQGRLTVALPKLRVYRNMFSKRDYRIIAQKPVTEADKNAKRQEPKSPGAAR